MGSRLEKNSSAVRKRIEGHEFTDEGGEEYEASAFNGFPDYFRRKKIKLQNLDAETRKAAAASGTKPQIFRGVVVHVMGYTQPPLHVLHRDLVEHGAGFLQYLDSKTMATHIVASTLPPKKTVDYSRYRIVKPAWVTDSIAAGKLLPWGEYRVFDEGPRQKTLKFGEAGLMSQANPQSQLRYREQTQNSSYNAQFQKAAASTQAESSPFRAELATQKSARPADQPELAEQFYEEQGDLMDMETTVETIDNHTDALLSDRAQGQAPDDGAGLEQMSVSIENPGVGKDSPNAGDTQGTAGPDVTANSKPMTSEEHNAWLLSDPRLRKSSTANPDFLNQYYSESRLHHLSTWKADLKSKMQRLATEKGLAAKPVKRRPGSSRYIMHVDFDSFFCAVSLKKHPELKDKPTVISHSPGPGSEIASCNYPARKFGIKNGMWMKRALEMCPDLKTLPYDFPAYEEASAQFYEAIMAVGGVLQSVSVDEALLDVTSIVLRQAASDGLGVDEGSIWREQEKVDNLATGLREEIKRRTDCDVSVGVGGNILLAKVALRRAKPAGQYQIKPEEVLDILGELSVESLPGVAYSISGKLEEIGVKFVKDIRQLSKEKLSAVLGPKTGEKLWDYSRGIDKVEVGEQSIRKSVSAEINWGIRFINQAEAEEFVLNLCKELEKRLLNEGVKGTHLTFKIMRRAMDAPLDPHKHLGHGKCDTFNKSAVFGVATNNAALIGKEAIAILRSFKFSPGDLRGLGVQLTKLEPMKAAATGSESSQKKLSFGKTSMTGSGKKPQTLEAIQDEDDVAAHESLESNREAPHDYISIDPLTPRKPKTHPALALAEANAADVKARTPLNMTGTQFVMPTNPDPAVVAELPFDIRKRLLAQAGRREGLASVSREQSPAVDSRNQSPTPSDVLPSQIDPDVFNALPDDMKAEVLASYGRKGGSGGQSVLPQSPRKDRVIQKKTTVTPTKRGSGRGVLSRARERQHDADARLVQTNFLGLGKRPADESVVQDTSDEEPVEELDEEFLAELPEEVRKEVIADHRRRRLAQRSGLGVQSHYRRQAAIDGDFILPGGQTKLHFPARPARVTFTTSSLSSLEEVKDMLNVWHQETLDEGPHRADVEVFEKYLASVVVEERDMEKARKLVGWVELLNQGAESSEASAKASSVWESALLGLKGAVQKAMKQRGLGPLDLG